MNVTKIASVFGLSLTLVFAGCAGEDAAANASADASATTTAAAAPADVPATGNVIEVQMITDEKGNYFEPADITAKQGDVIRFNLVSGVHNVSFPPSHNVDATTLPEASPMLQLPGQSYDLTVNLEPGNYVFQCDPHAALGMVGTLMVQ